MIRLLLRANPAGVRRYLMAIILAVAVFSPSRALPVAVPPTHGADSCRVLFNRSIREKFDRSGRIEINDDATTRQCFVDSLFCPFAEKTHYRTAISPLTNGLIRNDLLHLVGKTAIIRVDDIGVVGFLKAVGDPTFLAIADVLDDHGDYVLHQGMMYSPTKEFASRISETFETSLNLQYPVVSVSRLKLIPARLFHTPIVTEHYSLLESLLLKWKRRSLPNFARPLTSENLHERLDEVLIRAEEISFSTRVDVRSRQ